MSIDTIIIGHMLTSMLRTCALMLIAIGGMTAYEAPPEMQSIEAFIAHTRAAQQPRLWASNWCVQIQVDSVAIPAIGATAPITGVAGSHVLDAERGYPVAVVPGRRVLMRGVAERIGTDTMMARWTSASRDGIAWHDCDLMAVVKPQNPLQPLAAPGGQVKPGTVWSNLVMVSPLMQVMPQ